MFLLSLTPVLILLALVQGGPVVFSANKFAVLETAVQDEANHCKDMVRGEVVAEAVRVAGSGNVPSPSLSTNPVTSIGVGQLP